MTAEEYDDLVETAHAGTDELDEVQLRSLVDTLCAWHPQKVLRALEEVIRD